MFNRMRTCYLHLWHLTLFKPHYHRMLRSLRPSRSTKHTMFLLLGLEHHHLERDKHISLLLHLYRHRPRLLLELRLRPKPRPQTRMHLLCAPTRMCSLYIRILHPIRISHYLPMKGFMKTTTMMMMVFYHTHPRHYRCRCLEMTRISSVPDSRTPLDGTVSSRGTIINVIRQPPNWVGDLVKGEGKAKVLRKGSGGGRVRAEVSLAWFRWLRCSYARVALKMGASRVETAALYLQ